MEGWMRDLPPAGFQINKPSGGREYETAGAEMKRSASESISRQTWRKPCTPMATCARWPSHGRSFHMYAVHSACVWGPRLHSATAMLHLTSQSGRKWVYRPIYNWQDWSFCFLKWVWRQNAGHKWGWGEEWLIQGYFLSSPKTTRVSPSVCASLIHSDTGVDFLWARLARERKMHMHRLTQFWPHHLLLYDVELLTPLNLMSLFDVRLYIKLTPVFVITNTVSQFDRTMADGGRIWESCIIINSFIYISVWNHLWHRNDTPLTP